MDILIFLGSKFYDTSIGAKIFLFGGQFRELRGPKVWHMAETFVFGGQKQLQSIAQSQRFPTICSENFYLIGTKS